MRTIDKNDVAMDPSGFVLLADYIPHIVQEIRYYSTYNFIGDRIDGYEAPVALLTIEAARALRSVSNELIVQGYRLKVFDAYRPACAVKHFVFWGIEDQDIRMKPYFYPDLEKQELFAKGYIAKQSSHSRGSAVDLTLLDMQTGKELDMGSPFDLFSEVSHCLHAGDYAVLVLLTLLVTAAELLLPRITKMLSGFILESGNTMILWSTAAFLLCVLIASQLFSVSRALAMRRIQTKVTLPMEAAMMMRLISLPAPFFRQFSSGDLASRITQVSNLCTILYSLFRGLPVLSL